MSLPLIVNSDFDTRDITRVRPSKVGQLDIADTKAFKQTVIIENKLQEIFGKILTAILKSGKDIAKIRFDYNDIVYDYWAGAVQNVYIIATNYTNDAHSTVPRLTGADRDQMKKLADYGNSLFFLKIDKYLRREQDIETSDYFYSVQDSIAKLMQVSNPSAQTITPKKTMLKPLSIDKQIDHLVTNVLFMTLNIGVVQKTRQLQNLKNADQTVALAGGLFGNLFGESTQQTVTDIVVAVSAFHALIEQGIRGLFKAGKKLVGKETVQGRLNLIQSTAQNAQATSLIMWVTKMDEKVCIKYCQPLDGEQFDAADPNHPIPIISTHPNCRCRLLNVDANGNVLADGVDAI